MKIVKKEIKKLRIKATNYVKKIKKDHLIREFFKNNELFITYFLVCILLIFNNLHFYIKQTAKITNYI